MSDSCQGFKWHSASLSHKEIITIPVHEGLWRGKIFFIFGNFPADGNREAPAENVPLHWGTEGVPAHQQGEQWVCTTRDRNKLILWSHKPFLFLKGHDWHQPPPGEMWGPCRCSHFFSCTSHGSAGFIILSLLLWVVGSLQLCQGLLSTGIHEQRASYSRGRSRGYSRTLLLSLPWSCWNSRAMTGAVDGFPANKGCLVSGLPSLTRSALSYPWLSLVREMLRWVKPSCTQGQGMSGWETLSKAGPALFVVKQVKLAMWHRQFLAICIVI